MKISRKTILIVLFICICAVLWIFFTAAGERPYRYLRADHIAAIELSAESEASSIAVLTQTEDIDGVIAALKEVKTYSNVMAKDIPQRQYQINLVYDDGRDRPVNFALAQPQFQDGGGTACITINKRWYQIKEQQAQELYDLFMQLK